MSTQRDDHSPTNQPDPAHHEWEAYRQSSDSYRISSLPPGFGKADAEAADFFMLWDNGADANTLVHAIRKMSALALAIVEARFKQRDVVQAERPTTE